jgi:hypothetical protein
MSSTGPSDDRGRIVITPDEAKSSHVDDLLQRQASLRGERIEVERGRAWYYRSWFVLGLVGLLAGLVAWSIIEPGFEDYIYIQGVAQEVDRSQEGFAYITSGDSYLELNDSIAAVVEMEGERVHVLRTTRNMVDGEAVPLVPATLRQGQTIGAWVEVISMNGETLAFAHYVDTAPGAWDDPGLSLERRQAHADIFSTLFFSIVAGIVGLFIGAADGIICRLPRRALLCGGVGLLIGFAGGFFSGILAGLVYTPLNDLAMQTNTGIDTDLTTTGFFVQIVGRGLAWTFAGAAMGLGQGVVLRSSRLLLYGLLGGLIGGLIGGLLFDPIDLILLAGDSPGAHTSRLVGLLAIGGAVGGTIGVVELLARDAWLRMVEGPLKGKEFLLFKDRMTMGSSPRSAIYLFNDPEVEPDHAVLRTMGEDCEIECVAPGAHVQVNTQQVQRQRLRHGDRITIGRTAFVYEKRGVAT